MAQMVKRLPTMRETQVQSLHREDLLEKGMATHSSILAPPTPPKKKGLKEIMEEMQPNLWIIISLYIILL